MEVDIVTCKKCGKIFQRTSSKRICPDCERLMEEKFTEVRDYIREHPDVTIMQTSRDMEISVEQIKQWVREERLLFSSPEGSGITCLSCGVPIATGKYCAKCKEQLANSLGRAYSSAAAAPQKKSSDSGARMRFLDRDE